MLFPKTLGVLGSPALVPFGDAFLSLEHQKKAPQHPAPPTQAPAIAKAANFHRLREESGAGSSSSG
jgi:hypothetical protein